MSDIRSDPGLCNRCGFARQIISNRGSHFVLCKRSLEDDRYARYPRLPVFRCPGFDSAADE